MIRKSIILCFSMASKVLRKTPLARIPILNKAHSALFGIFNKENRAKFGPFWVKFDPRDRYIAKKLTLYGGYEEKEIALFCSLLEPGDCVLDVGANIGLYSLHISRKVGPSGKVLAFEPDPENRLLLKENLEFNGCNNVMVLGYALGSKEGNANLFQVAENRGNLSFSDLGGTNQSISVQVRRGDNVIKELNLMPKAAKIDVEGAEQEVLDGLGANKPNILLFEYVPHQLRAQGQDPIKVLESLEAEGFKIESVDPQTGNRLRIQPQQLTRLADETGDDYNVLAIK